MTRQLSSLTVLLAVAAGLAAAATLAILATVIARISAGASISDFLAFYSAGYLVRTGQGVHLYDTAAVEWAERFLYHGPLDQPVDYPLPVFVAWLFAPLSKLAYPTAYWVYASITTALLGTLLWTLNRRLADVPTGERRLLIACTALALPSLTTIAAGQVDFIAVAGLLAGYLLLRADRRMLAGFALSLVLVKPQLLVGVVLFLLVRKDWRTMGALALIGVPLLLVPALLTGPSTLAANLRVVAHLDSRGLAAAHLGVMANWRGFIVSATDSDRPLYWIPGFFAIAVGATALAIARWRDIHGTTGFDRGYSLAVLLPLLVSPHVHTLNVGMLPAALYLRSYLGPASTTDARRRAINVTLLIFILLFGLPFLAIQGINLTVFLCIGCYLAASFRWPGLDGGVGVEHIAVDGDRDECMGGPPSRVGASHRPSDQHRDAAA